jgi:hypothetical protein
MLDEHNLYRNFAVLGYEDGGAKEVIGTNPV